MVSLHHAMSTCPFSMLIITDKFNKFVNLQIPAISRWHLITVRTYFKYLLSRRKFICNRIRGEYTIQRRRNSVPLDLFGPNCPLRWANILNSMSEMEIHQRISLGMAYVMNWIVAGLNLSGWLIKICKLWVYGDFREIFENIFVC